MKRNILFTLLFMASFTVRAQMKYAGCSSAKNNGFTKKSPFLSNSQLNEQAKYDVQFYQLDLAMSNTTTYLSGICTVKGKAIATTDSILLELFDSFNIDSVLLGETSVGFTHANNVLKIASNLSENQNFSAQIFYRGTPPSEATNPLGGSGLSHANVNSWNTQVTWSLSEPFLAYEWFPVKQILSDKADSCAINITIDNSLKAGANGVLDSISDNGNGTSTYHWFHRHPIAYYLISVAVGDYDEYTVHAFVGTPNEMPIVNYIYPGSLSAYQEDIDNTVNFIELYSNLYGMYPFVDEKYGHCMAPIGGGMEHQTMTTQSAMDATLTAHELAHQWFGDFVTCNSWSEIWLNEGFASYSEELMLEHLYPGQEKGYMASRHTRVKNQPGGSVWVQDSTDDAAIFSSRLTYDKGAAIIHTLRYLVDNDTLFFAGLKNYLTTHKNKTASIADFKSIMESTTGLSLDDFFDQWYFGEGFPSYKINWNDAQGGLLLDVVETTSTSVTPLFTTPLELKISRFNSLPDTVIRIPISSNDESLFIPDFPYIKNIVRIDPNGWIICSVKGIVKDENMQVETHELPEGNSFTVYPTPTQGILYLDAPKQGNYTAEILDDFGKEIRQIRFKLKGQFSTSNLAAGSYIIRITDEKSGQQIHRIIKK